MVITGGYIAPGIVDMLSIWSGDWLTGIGWNEYAVLVISMLLNFATEFLYDRFVVFGGSIDAAVSKNVQYLEICT